MTKVAIDWISGQDENVEVEDTFTPFVTELSPDRWPYEGVTTYVLTYHNKTNDTECIRFKNMDVCQLVEEFSQESGKDIWICGGAKVVEQLIEKI